MEQNKVPVPTNPKSALNLPSLPSTNSPQQVTNYAQLPMDGNGPITYFQVTSPQSPSITAPSNVHVQLPSNGTYGQLPPSNYSSNYGQLPPSNYSSNYGQLPTSNAPSKTYGQIPSKNLTYGQLPTSNAPTVSYNYGQIPSNSAPSNEMQGAYEVSSAMLRDRLAKEEKGEENLKILDGMVADDIIVVPGTYDHIHNVLTALKMPFTIVQAHEIPKLTLRPDQTVYVNCASSFPAEAAIRLSGFVEAGGMLITTDWALKNVLEVGFPNTVQYNNVPTPDCVVGIELIDKEDEVVKGFMDEDKDAKPQWWLESSSYPIKVLDHERVKVLVRSSELGKNYGEDPVIVRITWGKGVVYHMISHFYLQRSETKNMKQASNANNYMASKGVSVETINQVNSNASYANLNYAQVQSAYTSTDFVSRAALVQKKKFNS